MSQIHELKTWPAYFEAVLDGSKPFEVRRADRPFATGDTLHLREWDPATQAYSGRVVEVVVTYKLTDHEGVREGFCVLGVRPVRKKGWTGTCGGCERPANTRIDWLGTAFDYCGPCARRMLAALRRVDSAMLLEPTPCPDCGASRRFEVGPGDAIHSVCGCGRRGSRDDLKPGEVRG